MSFPTILFVHGSWHTPQHFRPVRDVFEKAGYPTLCPRQPSVGTVPPLGLIDDVQSIQDKLVQLIEHQERDVIVVAHSYGGIIATQAVEQRFAKEAQKENGKKGGVIGILYMCAFLITTGESLADAMGGSLPPFVLVDGDDMITMLEPENRLYNDLPPSAQRFWVSKLLRSPRVTAYTPISYAAYLHHPVTYLFCGNDQALPVTVQQLMVEKIRGLGVQVVEQTCDAGHSPYLSMPEKILEVVRTMSD